jgi:hypothetical protein
MRRFGVDTLTVREYGSNSMKANAVAEAIERLGGVTQATVRTGIPTATWHRWRKVGFILDSRVLFRVAALTGIPAHELAGLESAGPDGTGGQRTDEAVLDAAVAHARAVTDAAAVSPPASAHARDRSWRKGGKPRRSSS